MSASRVICKHHAMQTTASTGIQNIQEAILAGHSQVPEISRSVGIVPQMQTQGSTAALRSPCASRDALVRSHHGELDARHRVQLRSLSEQTFVPRRSARLPVMILRIRCVLGHFICSGSLRRAVSFLQHKADLQVRIHKSSFFLLQMNRRDLQTPWFACGMLHVRDFRSALVCYQARTKSMKIRRAAGSYPALITTTS